MLFVNFGNYSQQHLLFILNGLVFHLVPDPPSFSPVVSSNTFCETEAQEGKSEAERVESHMETCILLLSVLAKAGGRHIGFLLPTSGLQLTCGRIGSLLTYAFLFAGWLCCLVFITLIQMLIF